MICITSYLEYNNPSSACYSLGLKSEENNTDRRYTYSKKQGMTA